mgnify:CR=1 FL=1
MKKKQTQEIKELADAKRNKAVKMIKLEEQMLQKEVANNISLLENERFRLAEENKARVLKYRKEKEAEGNRLIYTDNYVKLKMAEVFANNTKLYFSGRRSPLGIIFEKLMKENDK